LADGIEQSHLAFDCKIGMLRAAAAQERFFKGQPPVSLAG